MKKVLLVSTALVAGVVGAQAADMSAPAYKAPAAPLAAPGWRGFYIGGQVGYASDPSTLQPGAPPPGFTSFFTGTLAGAPQGFTGGGRVGYDWETAGLVWGIESDFNGGDISRSGSISLGGGLLGASWNEKVDWWGSTNLRLGIPFLANGALAYGLGGVAYGNRTMDASGNAGPFTTSGSFGGTSVGWDVGAGLATKISPASEIFVEGRWVDLGTVSGQIGGNVLGTTIVAPVSQKFNFAVGQVGYAYHF
jgi:outer membrane immunogenic protein